MGLAAATAQDFAAEVSAVFAAAKLPEKQVAKLSMKFTQLAADMSSFFNVPAADALAALRSGLVGEAEPLRRFGVLLSEAAVKAEAVRLGIAKTGAELTEQQKVQARASLIMRSLNKASGDYARTSDGVANRMRAAGERAKELGARFGQLLIPVVQKLLDIGEKVLGWFANMDEAQRKTALKVLAVAAAIGPLLIVLGKLIIGFGNVVKAFSVISKAFSTNPWILLIAATIAIAVLIITNWDKIKRVLIKVWDALKEAAQDTWNAILRAIGTVLAALLTGFRHWLAFWFSFVGAFLHGAAAAFGWLPGIGGKLKKARDAFDGFRDRVLGALDAQIKKFRQWGDEVVQQLARGTEAGRRMERQMRNIRPPGFGKPPRNFQHGGTVPGPRWRPVPIIAHGGERIIQAGSRAGGGGIHVTVHVDARGSSGIDTRALARALRDDLHRELLNLKRRGAKLGLD
jgi:hypothetical protein